MARGPGVGDTGELSINLGASGTAGAVPVPIPAELWLAVTFSAGASHTVKGGYRNGKTGQARAPPSTGTFYYSGRLYDRVEFSGTDANIAWEIVDLLGVPVFGQVPAAGGASKPVAVAYAGGTVETTSATPVSTGFGLGPISPSSLAAIIGQISGGANSGTTNPKFYIYRNTTGVPASGTAVGTDTKICTVLIGVTGLITGTPFPIPIIGDDASPVSGAYYYLAYSADGTNDVFLIAASSSSSTLVAVFA